MLLTVAQWCLRAERLERQFGAADQQSIGLVGNVEDGGDRSCHTVRGTDKESKIRRVKDYIRGKV
jgi:hypothetical protein